MREYGQIRGQLNHVNEKINRAHAAYRLRAQISGTDTFNVVIADASDQTRTVASTEEAMGYKPSPDAT
jgi:hypothetical protein